MNLVDTNILVYAYDRSEGSKHAACKRIIAEIWGGKREGAVSVQNLSELYVGLTKKVTNPLDEKIAEEIIASIVRFTGWRVLEFNKHTVLSAARLSRACRAPYFDALLAATMQENGVDAIITEDEEHFSKIPGIEVVNPLRRKKTLIISRAKTVYDFFSRRKTRC